MVVSDPGTGFRGFAKVKTGCLICASNAPSYMRDMADAVCDGSADERVWQEFLTEKVSEGTTIYCIGTFYTTATINGISHLTVIGLGDTQFHPVAAGTHDIWTFAAKTDFHFRNVEIDCDSTGDIGINIDSSCSRFSLDDVYIHSCDEYPVVVGSNNISEDVYNLKSSGNHQVSGSFRMASQGTGVPVTTASPNGFDLHVKPVTVLTAGATGKTCGIRMRYEVGADQTNQISVIAISGHLRVKKDLADGSHSGIEGYVEASETGTVISGTATTQTAAGQFAIELSAAVTVSTGWLCGISVDSSVHASATISSAEFAGVRIKKSGSAQDWEYGIHITASKTGILMGDVGATTEHFLDMADGYLGKVIETGSYSSSVDKGVTLVATNNKPVAFLFDDSGSALGTADYRAVLSRVYLLVDQSNSFTLNAIRGQIKLADDKDISDSGAVVAPLTGYFEFAGTANRTLTGHISGTRSALEEGASGTTTIAASSYYSGFEATLNSSRTYTVTGDMAAFVCNKSGGTSDWPVGLLLDDVTIAIEVGGSPTHLLDLTDCTEGAGKIYDKVNAASNVIIGNILIKDTDGNAGYINVYSDQGDA